MASYTPVPLAYSTFSPNVGVESKPPVIFAHGLTASKEYWDTIPQAVADVTGRKVYAIDARNHGDSEWSDVFDFDCNVDDLLHFMDTVDIPRAVLLGHSMGGVTAIKTALREPDRVEKLIVEDMNVQKLPQQLHDMCPVFFNLARAAIQRVPEGVDQDTAKKTIVDFILLNLPDEMKMFCNTKTLQENMPLQLKSSGDGRFSYKSNLDVLEKALKDVPALFSDYSGEFNGPALFVFGKLSPFNVASDEPNIKKLIPNAELVAMDTSHSVHAECPAEFLEAVLNFILKE